MTLFKKITQEIDMHQGKITFADYMALALYTPALGYYMTDRPKLGKTGDFITAPEISPLFAECIARQFQQVLAKIPEGDILEIGAGSGKFAADVLFALEKLNALPKNYYIFDTSPHLQQLQKQFLQQRCPHLFAKITWLKSLPEIPIKGIIFANEVLDALPIHLFQMTKEGLKEKYVAYQDQNFIWQLDDPCMQMHAVLSSLKNSFPFPMGYSSEVNLSIQPWLKSLAHCLEQGLILLFDYGYDRKEYYHPDRDQGTLMCFHQHQKNTNPLILTGLQDITAHIDFTAVAEASLEAHLEIAGYTTQAGFLLSCGLIDLLHDKHPRSFHDYQKQLAVKTLTLPSEMGEIIKVMGLQKNLPLPYLGFHLMDRSQNL